MSAGFVLATGFIAVACGAFSKQQKDTNEEALSPTAEATPTPAAETPVNTSPVVATTPSPSPTPAPPPVAAVWIAQNAGRFLAGYSTAGEPVQIIDLSSYFSTGGVSALTFIDKNNLLAFVDPGTAGERIVRLDLSGTTPQINASWFTDPTNFNNVTVNKIVTDTGGRLYLNKTSTFEKLTYAMPSTVIRSSAGGWPVASGACALTTTQFVSTAVVDAATYLIGFSSGVNSRINVYSASSPASCAAGSSYNFGAAPGVPGATTYTPVGAVQMPDGKIYVRYHSTTTPVIVSYDIAGGATPALSNPVTVYNDGGVLGASATVGRDLAKLDATTLLVPDWLTDSIHKVKTNGEYLGIFRADGYTIDVSAIAIRPE